MYVGVREWVRGVCVHIMHVHSLHTCKCMCSEVFFYIIV